MGGGGGGHQGIHSNNCPPNLPPTHNHHHHHQPQQPHTRGPHMGGFPGPMPGFPGGGGMPPNHQHHSHHGHGGPQMCNLAQPSMQAPQAVRKNVILVMGAPKSGTTTVASKIAERMRFYLVEAPKHDEEEVADKYEHLRDQFKEQSSARGFVICGFGADSEADIYYIFSMVNQFSLVLSFGVFLDMPAAEIPKLQGGDECTTPQMVNYAVGYECCSKHFSNRSDAAFTCVQCIDENGARKSAADLQAEVFDALNTIYPSSAGALPPIKAPLELSGGAPSESKGYWSMVTDHSKFAEAVVALDDCLGSSVKKAGVLGFPLRGVGASVNYGKFVRHYAQLKSYEVTIAVSGAKRVVVFNVGDDVFFLPENCSCVYALTNGSTMPKVIDANSENPTTYVLEAEIVEWDGMPNLMARDVLFFKGQHCNKTPWAKRREILDAHFQRQGGDLYCIVSKTFSIGNIAEAIGLGDTMTRNCKQPGAVFLSSLRFEHPGLYKLATHDAKLFSWSGLSAPVVCVRVWGSQETTINRKPVYTFKVLVIDDESGVEKPIAGVTLVVDNAVVDEMQLNDGQIVDCKVEHVERPAKPGNNRKNSALQQQMITEDVWGVVRRRSDLAYPLYASTVDDMLTGRWETNNMVRACQAMRDE
jgi:hypothetical protein